MTNETAITSFRNNYDFLSNFYAAPVTYEGITYPNVETAFQAQKTLDPAVRRTFVNVSPGEAKRMGRRVVLRPDWETVKDGIMLDLLRQKFTQNPDLEAKLQLTGHAHLEEGNTWGDRYWGTVNGVGKNMLGLLLMQVRGELRK